MKLREVIASLIVLAFIILVVVLYNAGVFGHVGPR